MSLTMGKDFQPFPPRPNRKDSSRWVNRVIILPPKAQGLALKASHLTLRPPPGPASMEVKSCSNCTVYVANANK